MLLIMVITIIQIPPRDPPEPRGPELRRGALSRNGCGLKRRMDVHTHEDRYGRFSKAHVLFVLPDPGALNSCMHKSP